MNPFDLDDTPILSARVERIIISTSYIFMGVILALIAFIVGVQVGMRV